MLHYGAVIRTRTTILCILLGFLYCSGCGADATFEGGASSSAQSEPSATELLRDTLSSGAFQASAATVTIETTVETLSDLSTLVEGSVREGVLETKDLTISAGKTLSELTSEPPPLAQLGVEFTYFDEQRLHAISEANDALHDLREAQGILESLVSAAPRSAHAAFDESLSFLAACIDDTMGTIEQFGGQIDEDPEAFSGSLFLVQRSPSHTNIGARTRAGA